MTPTGDEFTAAPPVDSEVPDWRELLAGQRYSAARNAYLITGGTDVGIREALTALSDLRELLCERAYNRALDRLERLEGVAALADWALVRAEVELLKESAAALEQREVDKAREILERGNAQWFGAEWLTQLGTTYVYDKELVQAGALFTQATDLDPQHYRALTNLGNVALEEGRVDDAIELYEQALKIHDQFPNAHHNLGVAYRKKGHLSKSVRSLRRAQRTQQRHDAVEARETLGKWAGPGTAKYVKWALWGALIVGGYYLLKSMGFLG